MKGENRRRERSVELVPAEEERLQVNEGGEIRNRAKEGVVLETQNSELVETAESRGGEVATDSDAGDNLQRVRRRGKQDTFKSLSVEFNLFKLKPPLSLLSSLSSRFALFQFNRV